MNIAFIANGQKCAFFDLIGNSITQKISSIKVFWICVSKHQYDYLLSRNYKKNNILLLNWDVRNSNGFAIGEYKLHELVYADRILKNHFNEGLVYLTKMQSLFYDFVKDNNLQYIFGEMTWAHEILMNRICRDKFIKQCYYLHPQSIRIPNGRFTFLDTEFQNTIFPIAEYIQPETEIERFEIPIKPVVPQRVADVSKDVQYSLTLKYKIRRLVDFFIINYFKTYPKDSLLGLKASIFKRVRFFINTEYNKIYYKKKLKKASLTDLEGKKFFFMTLHMQPEASVDVVGRYYEDQFLLIRDVWRILPNGYFLVIKEHTNAIGNRGKSFFKKCQTLKNTIIVDEQIHSHTLIQMAETIFTNSGTVALEGGLFEKDVFVFSEIFFDKLKYCHRISLDDLKYSSNFFHLLEFCKQRDKNKLGIKEYSEYILKSSFDGIIDPHKNSHYFTDTQNIEQISKSFIQFFNHL